MQPLNKILGKFIDDLGIGGGITLNIIRRQWAKIVGQTISLHTSPDTIKGKVLTVVVDSPQWLHHLSFFKEEIVKKLHPYNVDEIRLRIGKIPIEEPVHDKEKEFELTEDDRRFVENTIKVIKDEELKEKFRTLISRGLSKTKHKS
jgi:hypothetical protein